jgi:hypothetical protein
MSLCDSIDTLSMAYLDDELATEERHELEAHLTECSACRSHVDGERADHDMLRDALVAPRASDSMKMRVVRMLDTEDRARTRRRLSQWALPGSAMLAAAAALLVFVGMRGPADKATAVVDHGFRVESHAQPLDVQGATIQLPRPIERSNRLRAPHFEGIEGHETVQFAYNLALNGKPFLLAVQMIKGVQDNEMTGGTPYRIGDRMVSLIEDADGGRMVTFVDRENHLGYMFIADELSADELLNVVGHLP